MNIDLPPHNPTSPNVSEGWKKTFRLLEEGGYVPGTRSSRDLSWRERQRARINVWAFLFGPFYYFYLGMWRRGGLILGFALLLGSGLVLLEWFLGLRGTNRLAELIVEALCAHQANLDYYLFKTRGQTMWAYAKGLDAAATAFLVPAMGIVAFVAAATIVPGACKDKEVLDSVRYLIQEDLKHRFGQEMDVSVTDPTSLERDTRAFSQQCSCRLSIVHGSSTEVYRVLYATHSGDMPFTTQVEINDVVSP